MAKRVYNKSYLKACLTKGVRPKGMPYGDYSKFMKSIMKSDPLSKAEFDGMDEDEGEDDAGDAEPDADDKKDTKKSETADDSTVDPSALSKALDDYDAVASAVSTAGASRETYLQARLDAGTISKAEKAELGQIWSKSEAGAEATTTTGQTLRKSVAEQLSEDADTAGLINASDFVKSLVDTIDQSLSSLGEGIDRDQHATRELIKAQGGLVKALVQDQLLSHQLLKSQGVVIQALSDRLGLVESQPAPRRAVGNHNPRDVRTRDMNKSGSAVRDGGDSDRLSKAQVTQGLRQLMMKADQRSDEPAKQQIALAAARFETDGVVKPNIEAAIRQEIGALG